MARISQKAIDAAPNVTRLPTAAPRQVKQNYNRAAAAAKAALRRADPWPGEYVHPNDREALNLVLAAYKLTPTPEMLIVAELLTLLPWEQRRAIRNKFKTIASCGSEPHQQALAAVHPYAMNVGEECDYRRALLIRDKMEGR
jgi:hypothetical protein